LVRTYLFAGPTLPDAVELTSADHVDVLPPIAAGDLFRISPVPGDRVGIIDGYFHQARAIPHKEILAFLAEGVRVLGASSMGALRAAELHQFGMTGIGVIYDDFVQRRIEADDEVAVLHGPAESGYRAMSEALVNIRATLLGAQRAGLLTGAQRHELIARQAAIPYRERSFRRLAESARDVLPEDRLAALADFCRQRAVNLKRQDALLLLKELQADTAEAPPMPEPVARTLFLYSWELAARKPPGAEASDLAALRALQIFAPDYPRHYRRMVMSWLAERCRYECGTDPDVPSELAAVAHGAHAGRYATSGGGPDPGYFSGWLTSSERGLSRHERVARFLVRSFRIAPGILFDELPLRTLGHALQAGRRVAALAAHMNAKTRDSTPGFDVSALDAAKVSALLASQWGCPAEDLVFAAMDRGFDSQADAIAAARHLYLLAEYNPEYVRIGIGDQDGDGDARPAAPED
jgi:hypothetical protein